MMSGITWYDVLGVLPDAAPEDIDAAWQARRAALQPGALAGPRRMCCLGLPGQGVVHGG